MKPAIQAFLLLLAFLLLAATLTGGAVATIRWWNRDVVLPYQDPEPPPSSL